MSDDIPELPNQEELLKIIKQIEFGTEKRLPMMQGEAIKTVIQKYKIPAIKWGYGAQYIGVETKKQIIVWEDEGWRLIFMGIYNKDVD